MTHSNQFLYAAYVLQTECKQKEVNQAKAYLEQEAAVVVEAIQHVLPATRIRQFNFQKPPLVCVEFRKRSTPSPWNKKKCVFDFRRQSYLLQGTSCKQGLHRRIGKRRSCLLTRRRSWCYAFSDPCQLFCENEPAAHTVSDRIMYENVPPQLSGLKEEKEVPYPFLIIF
jgi:hypothetical protein